MDSIVVVALPSEDEKVHRISSEKQAHMTLLYLKDDPEFYNHVVRFVEHASTTLRPFGMEVDYRGTLGDDDADVLFMDAGRHNLALITDFRNSLLMDSRTKQLYDSAPQYPEWTPHVTLGYPETPAHEDTDEYRGIHWINFDRIAVWRGDSEGPMFRLNDAALEDHVTHEDLSTYEDTLAHYGVKGMKWGVRKDDRAAGRGPADVVVTQKKSGTFAKSKGGERQSATDEATNALATRQKAKASTTDALSNKELRSAIERMQLEQQFTRLEFQSDRRSKGRRLADGLFNARRYGGKKERRFEDAYEELGYTTRELMNSFLAEKQG